MINAVFISDLHLHPREPEIQIKFNQFIEWALSAVKSVYILGDFFHAWPGDDALDEWSNQIAMQLKRLVNNNIPIYYIHGNRDFLIGQQFSELVGWTVYSDPTLISLGNNHIIISHGDKYCINDKGHQWLRRLTRNQLFSRIFLKFSLKFRLNIVDKVRNYSKKNDKPRAQLDVVAEEIIKEFDLFKSDTLIHGHTHLAGLTLYQTNNHKFKRYVLSDWDDIPQLLCYDNTKGFYFLQLALLEI